MSRSKYRRTLRKILWLSEVYFYFVVLPSKPRLLYISVRHPASFLFFVICGVLFVTIFYSKYVGRKSECFLFACFFFWGGGGHNVSSTVLLRIEIPSAPRAGPLFRVITTYVHYANASVTHATPSPPLTVSFSCSVRSHVRAHANGLTYALHRPAVGSLKNTEWTAEEEQILIRKHREMGKKVRFNAGTESSTVRRVGGCGVVGWLAGGVSSTRDRRCVPCSCPRRCVAGRSQRGRSQ